MKRFTVNCWRVESLDDLVAVMNEGFIQHVGGEWNGNADALNDYFRWPEEEEFELELLGAKSLGSLRFQPSRGSSQLSWLELIRELARDHPQMRLTIT